MKAEEPGNPEWKAVTCRNDSRFGKDQHKHGVAKTVNRMPSGEAAGQRSHGKKHRHPLKGTVVQVAVKAPVLPGGASRVDKPDVSGQADGMTRRLIEMHREAQLLHQQLCESYDL